MATTLLAEIGQVLYDNIEIILIAAVPISTLVVYLARKINSRIVDVEGDTLKNLKALQDRIDEQKKEINQIHIDMQNRLEKNKEQVNKLYAEIHQLELELKLHINTLEIKLENKRNGGNRKTE